MSVLARRLSTCVHHHSRRASAGTLEQSTSPCADVKLSLPHDDRPTLHYSPKASPRCDPVPLINSPSPRRQFESSPVLQHNSISQVKKSHLHGCSFPFKPAAAVYATSPYLSPGVPPSNETRRSSVIGVSTTRLQWTPSLERRFSLDVLNVAKFRVSSPLPLASPYKSLG